MMHDPVFMLDLCILAYQLHAQTLVMPPDPYAEQMRQDATVKTGDRRRRFLDSLQEEIVRGNYPLWRGPAVLRGKSATGWIENPDLDPVVSDSTRICPHVPGLVRQNRDEEGWLFYRTPRSTQPPANGIAETIGITGTIGTVKVFEYASAAGPNLNPNLNPPQIQQQVITLPAVPAPIPAPAHTNDRLYCFEGGTGCTKIENTDHKAGAIWSLMGYVLAREDATSTATPKQYDVFIAFRGSRSDAVPLKRLNKARGS
jgi:hypothetical protein